MSYDNDEREHKTGRIAILSLVMIILASLFFAYKIDACKKQPIECVDEFIPFNIIDNSGRSCTPGATVEVVTSPPSAKSGIICHCSHVSSPTSP